MALFREFVYAWATGCAVLKARLASFTLKCAFQDETHPQSGAMAHVLYVAQARLARELQPSLA